MIALLLACLAVHGCHVPRAAYLERDLTARELRAMERFSYCRCGPEGSVDWDPSPDRHGRYRMWPSCNRYGWNGHRYVETRR
jgi:hypothetical protein